MKVFNMFIIAVCVIFLIKLRWPKTKSLYFTEGNTRKVSACFLCLHVCDIIRLRDDNARIHINGLLVSFGAFEREKNHVNLQATFEHCDTFLEMKI